MKRPAPLSRRPCRGTRPHPRLARNTRFRCNFGFRRGRLGHLGANRPRRRLRRNARFRRSGRSELRRYKAFQASQPEFCQAFWHRIKGPHRRIDRQTPLGMTNVVQCTITPFPRLCAHHRISHGVTLTSRKRLIRYIARILIQFVVIFRRPLKILEGCLAGILLVLPALQYQSSCLTCRILFGSRLLRSAASAS